MYNAALMSWGFLNAEGMCYVMKRIPSNNVARRSSHGRSANSRNSTSPWGSHVWKFSNEKTRVKDCRFSQSFGPTLTNTSFGDHGVFFDGKWQLSPKPEILLISQHPHDLLKSSLSDDYQILYSHPPREVQHFSRHSTVSSWGAPASSYLSK